MTTSTTVEASLESIEEVLQRTIDRGGFGPKPADLLEQALAATQALGARLVELQDFVVLEQDHRDELNMEAARQLWDAIASGPHRTDLEDLVSASPTLSVLRQAAVDIDAVHRFSDAEVTIATSMAEALGSYTHYLRLVAGRGVETSRAFAVKIDAAPGVKRLIEELTRTAAIEGFSMVARVDLKDRKPFWKPFDEVLARHWPYGAVKVRRGTVDPGWRSFLEGHWLTAYAYGIALDQFKRTGAAFEIYSNVEYRLPPDLGGGRSDVDVLVRTADILLCIECKSGKVLTTFAGHESAAAKSLQSAERLDRLLTTMGVELQRTYQLVYLPTPDQDDTGVAAAVSGGEVPLDVMTPAAIRTMVRQVASRVSGT